MIDLRSRHLSLTIDPVMGGSVTRFDVDTGKSVVPVMAAGDPSSAEVGESAMFLMAPFANRARGGRLCEGTREIVLPPNTEEPLPLHGVAWQRAWHVLDRTSNRATLSLDLAGTYPLELHMVYTVTLSDRCARFDLSLQNSSERPIPVGMGFHPYFPRRPDTQIGFAAHMLWPDGDGHLPNGAIPIPAAEDYSTPRGLPPGWRNQCYSAWTGEALIRQPSLGYDLAITSRELNVLMFFAAPDMARFALEPQSHVSGETHTGPDGLVALPPGQTLRSAIDISISF